ncbi:MAG: winged helix-turn-helix domain-containing protein [Pseudomonadota bacterium]
MSEIRVRRRPLEQTFRYTFGPAVFDEATMQLTVADEHVELEPKPLHLLQAFLERPGEVLTRDELLDLVWPEQTTTEGVLSNAVSKLRRALGDHLSDAIVTHSGVGYRFSPRVDRVATGQVLTSDLSFAPGQPVPERPPFVFEEQLSSGGRREVWQAHNPKTGERRVYKYANDAAGLGSLKREATLFRLLSNAYPNSNDFARLLDWNFSDEPFFLESENAGLSLAAWSDEGDPLAALDHDQRLALACQIVDAVAAAHRIGILHKDLKPSNILIRVDNAGVPRPVLVDFGSGGVFDRTRLDAAGVTPLGLTQTSSSSDMSDAGVTPLYAAPELLKGQAPSIRSDVYALGILVFQIITDQIGRPLTPGWEDLIDDPLLREDIAAAAHGDPARRLASADTFAEQLRALPARREVKAGEAKRLEDLSLANAALARAKARRPWALAAALFLVAGIGVSANLYRQAETARGEAERRAEQAQASRDFLKEVLLSADPRTPGAGVDASVREALLRADGTITERYAENPDISAVIAGTLSEIHTGLSDFAAAADAREREAEALTMQYGLTAPQTLIARYKQALAFVSAGQYDHAEALLDEIDADAGDLGRTTPEVAMQAAMVRGRLHLIRFDFAAASERLDQAAEIYQSAGIDDLTLLHLINLDRGQCYSRLGRADEAADLLETMTVAPYDDPAIVPLWRQARAKLFFGAALGFAGWHEEAEPVLLELIDDMSQIYGPDKVQVAEVRTTLARAYAATGRWDGALENHSAARQIFCDELGEEHLACLGTRGNEGRVQLQLGLPAEAAGNLRMSRAGLKAHTGEASPAVQVIGYHLATALIETGGYDEAGEILGSLDIASLDAGAPGNAWGPLLDGSQARLDIRRGDRSSGLPKLEDAIARMRDADVDNSMIQPFEADLAL